MEIQNTIITSSSGGDCYGDITGKDNLIDDYASGACSGISSAAVTNFDATLRDNDPSSGSGQATHTHALLSGSNAIDAVTDCTYVSDGSNPLFSDNQTVAADQRGVPRPQENACDVGAYEAAFAIWDGGGADENWSTAENWTGDTAPTTIHKVIFDNTSDKNALVDTPVTIVSLQIDSGYDGTITQGSNDLTLSSDWFQSGGTFTAPSGLMSVGGDFKHSGGTFTHNSGTFTFDGSGAQVFAGTTVFYDVTVSSDSTLQLATDSDFGYAGSFTLSGAFAPPSNAPNTVRLAGSSAQTLPSGATTLHSLVINNGATLSAPASLIIAGDWTNNGGFTHNNGAVTFNGSGAQTISGDNTFHDLFINGGLVGYWKLDEGSGGTTSDSSGYGHDGSLHNDTTWSTDTPSTAFPNPASLSFDGSGDYVEAPHDSALDAGLELTLSAWVKLVDPANDQKIVGKSPTTAGYMLGVANNTLYPEIWDSTGTRYTFKSGSIPAGAWTHVAVTWQSGGQMIGYIDGTQVDSIPASTHPIGASTNPLRIGVAPWNTSRYGVNGLVDDVRIYNRALSSTEIGDLTDGKHPNTAISTTILDAALDVDGDLTLNSGTLTQPQTVGYWKLDEDSGTTVADSSGNGNEGTLNGDPAWSPDTPSVHFSNSHALDFDGIDDYVAIDGVADDVSVDITIAFWVKADSGSTKRTLVAANTAAKDNVFILSIYEDDTYRIYDAGGGGWEGDTGADVADGTWHHLAYTSDGSTGRLYVDGEEKATHTPDYNFSSDDLWSLGQEWDSVISELLDGILDDVRIYNRVLSAAEIQALADGYDVRTHDITIAGDFIRNGGVFEAGGGMVTFDGSGVQTLDTDAITFHDLTVNSDATLTTVDVASVAVEGALTNHGATDETKTVSETGENHFDLADIDVDVTTKGELSSLQVVRRNTAHPQASSTIQTDKHWSITPTGGGYTVDLTKPHADLSDPQVCVATPALTGIALATPTTARRSPARVSPSCRTGPWATAFAWPR